MNYEEHLKAHAAKLEDDAKKKEQAAADHLIALEVASKEGQGLVLSVIKPELEKLEAALHAAHKQCTVKTSKKKVSSKIEIEYEIEIQLHSSPNVLKFEARPVEKAFRVSHHCPKLHNGAHEQDVGYKHNDSEFVQKKCEEFMRLGFPI